MVNSEVSNTSLLTLRSQEENRATIQTTRTKIERILWKQMHRKESRQLEKLPRTLGFFWGENIKSKKINHNFHPDLTGTTSYSGTGGYLFPQLPKPHLPSTRNPEWHFLQKNPLAKMRKISSQFGKTTSHNDVLSEAILHPRKANVLVNLFHFCTPNARQKPWSLLPNYQPNWTIRAHAPSNQISWFDFIDQFHQGQNGVKPY